MERKTTGNKKNPDLFSNLEGMTDADLLLLQQSLVRVRRTQVKRHLYKFALGVVTKTAAFMKFFTTLYSYAVWFVKALKEHTKNLLARHTATIAVPVISKRNLRLKPTKIKKRTRKAKK